MAEDNPEVWMRRAIALSRKGFPAPNPHVGCVLVREGHVVGEGWHEYAGGLHAEAAALRQAGSLARGARAFVTLEPCNHEGRQPACSKALIEAGIEAVTFACADPNPRVSGGGADAIRRAGLRVAQGVLEAEAREANVAWMESMRMRRPFITIKAAMSLDGRIALPSGESKWITGEAARRAGRRLRAEMGSVLVGSGTVAQDDPALTARIPGVRNQPTRIVLDPERVLDGGHRVFHEEGLCIRVVRAERAAADDLAHPTVEGAFDLPSLMTRLWESGITGVLVEGGPTTVSSFLRAGLADRIALFVGNVILGRGPAWVQAALADTLSEAVRWRIESVRRVGDDVLMKIDRMLP